MKTIASLIAISLGLWLPFCLCSVQAQELACPDYFTCGSYSVWSNATVIRITQKSAFDMDYDGCPDFRLIDVVFSGHRDDQLPYIICGWGDDTQALFAEPHVQMYLSKQESDCLALPPEARLAQRQLIPAQPPADSAWHWIQPTNVARLKGIGFGYTSRVLRYGFPSDDTIPLQPGYIHFQPTPPVTNVLFGIRIQKTDGWHLGWIRLHHYHPDPTRDGIVDVAEFSVNPIPDQDILAGVKLGTLLEVSTKGTNAINLSWSTNATNMVLEQKLKLGDPAWTVVPGITNNQYTVTPTNPSSFYRLKGSP